MEINDENVRKVPDEVKWSKQDKKSTLLNFVSFYSTLFYFERFA